MLLAALVDPGEGGQMKAQMNQEKNYYHRNMVFLLKPRGFEQ